MGVCVCGVCVCVCVCVGGGGCVHACLACFYDNLMSSKVHGLM